MDFVVLSIGRTATQWLKYALNEHPDIRCFHGPEPFKEVDPLDWDRYFADVHRLDWTGYLASGSFWGRIGKDAKHFGNVHGLNPMQWAKDPASYRRTYRCAQMTREPMARLALMLARWETDAALQPAEFGEYRRHGITGLTEIGFPPPDETLFAFACWQLFTSDAHFLRLDIPVYRTEDLSTPGTLARMTLQLCDADWRPDDMDRALAVQPIDARPAPSLTEDQKAYGLRLIAHFGLQPIYRSLGYLESETVA